MPCFVGLSMPTLATAHVENAESIWGVAAEPEQDEGAGSSPAPKMGCVSAPGHLLQTIGCFEIG